MREITRANRVTNQNTEHGRFLGNLVQSGSNKKSKKNCRFSNDMNYNLSALREVYFPCTVHQVQERQGCQHIIYDKRCSGTRTLILSACILMLSGGNERPLSGSRSFGRRRRRQRTRFSWKCKHNKRQESKDDVTAKRCDLQFHNRPQLQRGTDSATTTALSADSSGKPRILAERLAARYVTDTRPTNRPMTCDVSSVTGVSYE